MSTRKNLYRFLLIALLLALLAVPIVGAVTFGDASAQAPSYSNELVVFDTPPGAAQAIACQTGDPGGSGGGGC